MADTSLKSRLHNAADALQHMLRSASDLLTWLRHESIDCRLVESHVRRLKSYRALAGGFIHGRNPRDRAERESCLQLRKLLAGVARRTEWYGIMGPSVAEIAMTACDYAALSAASALKRQAKARPSNAEIKLLKPRAFERLGLLVRQEVARAELRLRKPTSDTPAVLPGRAIGAPAKRKRGPKPSVTQADAELLARWERAKGAGVTRKQFERDDGCGRGAVEAAQKRIRAARQRERERTI